MVRNRYSKKGNAAVAFCSRLKNAHDMRLRNDRFYSQQTHSYRLSAEIWTVDEWNEAEEAHAATAVAAEATSSGAAAAALAAASAFSHENLTSGIKNFRENDIIYALATIHVRCEKNWRPEENDTLDFSILHVKYLSSVPSKPLTYWLSKIVLAFSRESTHASSHTFVNCYLLFMSLCGCIQEKPLH